MEEGRASVGGKLIQREVIKAVTNTPRDISSGVEVIDVCKAVEEMIKEGEERGELRMLVKLVKKGRITIEQAVEDAEMTVEQFEKVMFIEVYPRLRLKVRSKTLAVYAVLR